MDRDTVRQTEREEKRQNDTKSETEREGAEGDRERERGRGREIKNTSALQIVFKWKACVTKQEMKELRYGRGGSGVFTQHNQNQTKLSKRISLTHSNNYTITQQNSRPPAHQTPERRNKGGR